MAERILAGTQQGLQVWRGAGRRWEELDVELPPGTVDAIDGPAERPGTVYASVAGEGLCRSDDGGQRWRTVFSGNVRAVTVDPGDPDVVYAGTEPIHLFRSEDGGESWEELTALQELPSEVRAQWTYPRPPHREHVRHIFVSPDDSRTIHVCLEHGGIVRTFDRGASFEDVSGGIDYLDIHHISTTPEGAGPMFVATARGFFRSEDPAAGWRRAENGMTRDYFHDFVFLPGTPPVVLVATADKSPGFWDRPERAQGAVFRSRDLASNWERVGVGRGLPDHMQQMVWALAQRPDEPQRVYAGLGAVSRGRSSDASQQGKGEILVSEDEGESWERLPLELPADRVLLVRPE